MNTTSLRKGGTKTVKLKILILSFLAVFLVAGSASAVRIYDNYYGADDDYSYGDVIGNVNNFGIDWMDVEISTDTLSVKIRTNYRGDAWDGFVNLDTDFGDLFISTDGWNPNGAQPYLADNFYKNGEEWEYAFDVSAGYLHKITASDIRFSDDLIGPQGNWTYRNGQEVLVKEGLSSGLQGIVGSYAGGYYSFDVYFGTLGWSLEELGFHWTMTCGNDVIEGAAPVPEPATMLLLGTGLVCFAGFGRKRFFKRG